MNHSWVEPPPGLGVNENHLLDLDDKQKTFSCDSTAETVESLFRRNSGLKTASEK